MYAVKETLIFTSKFGMVKFSNQELPENGKFHCNGS